MKSPSSWCRVRCSVVGISNVEPSISVLRPSHESPRTSMPQRAASLSNSDQSASPVAAASKSPSRQRGAKWWTSAPDSAAITPPQFRRSRSLRCQDDHRHPHTRHRRHASCYLSRTRRGLFLSRLLTHLRKRAPTAPLKLYIFPLFAGLL